MEEMSEAESNPESPPKMSPRKTEEDNNQDREEELSVGSPGNFYNNINIVCKNTAYFFKSKQQFE